MWTQNRLSIPEKTIKTIVLIENILAIYGAEDILYTLRDHIIGLNCGIWDYSASIISKFGNDMNYLIPDRNKYVNISQKFLFAYMRMVVATCHQHGALATGGMAAQILPPTEKGKLNKKSRDIVDLVVKNKTTEINMGVDGFMVHDFRLVPHMNKLWLELIGTKDNQISQIPNVSDINALTFLEIPKGGVTVDGLR